MEDLGGVVEDTGCESESAFVDVQAFPRTQRCELPEGIRPNNCVMLEVDREYSHLDGALEHLP